MTTENTTPNAAVATQTATETPVRWDDPSLWQGVKLAACNGCAQRHVTRNGLCWTCEQAAKTPAKETLYKTAKARIACAHFSAGQYVAIRHFGFNGEHYFTCAATRENLDVPERSATYRMAHLTEFCL